MRRLTDSVRKERRQRCGPFSLHVSHHRPSKNVARLPASGVDRRGNPVAKSIRFVPDLSRNQSATTQNSTYKNIQQNTCRSSGVSDRKQCRLGLAFGVFPHHQPQNKSPSIRFSLLLKKAQNNGKSFRRRQLGNSDGFHRNGGNAECSLSFVVARWLAKVVRN